mgnify:CR=1 FL=1
MRIWIMNYKYVPFEHLRKLGENWERRWNSLYVHLYGIEFLKRFYDFRIFGCKYIMWTFDGCPRFAIDWMTRCKNVFRKIWSYGSVWGRPTFRNSFYRPSRSRDGDQRLSRLIRLTSSVSKSSCSLIFFIEALQFICCRFAWQIPVFKGHGVEYMVRADDLVSGDMNYL